MSDGTKETVEAVAWQCRDALYPFVNGIVTTEKSTVDAWLESGIEFVPLYPPASPAQSNGDEGRARCTTITGSWSNNAELIALCMDMLGDVPGETLDYKVEKLVSYHLEMQVMLSEASARLAKATAALEDLARQKTLAEMEAEDEGAEDRADFVGAYDAMIGIARTALKDIQS